MAIDWKDEYVEMVRAMYHGEGRSSSQIANSLNAAFGIGATRNAVIGIIHRRGISMGGRGNQVRIRGNNAMSKRRKPAAQKPKYRLGTSALTGLWRSAPTDHAVADNVKIDDNEIPVADRVRMHVKDEAGNIHANEALTDKCCRWPLGDPLSEDFGFCGKDKVDGLPYCPPHAARAFSPAPLRPINFDRGRVHPRPSRVTATKADA